MYQEIKKLKAIKDTVLERTGEEAIAPHQQKNRLPRQHPLFIPRKIEKEQRMIFAGKENECEKNFHNRTKEDERNGKLDHTSSELHEFMESITKKINELTNNIKEWQTRKTVETRYQEIPFESVFVDKLNTGKKKLQIEKCLGKSLMEVFSSGFYLY